LNVLVVVPIHVACSGYLYPWNGGISFFELNGETTAGFRNFLEVPYDGVLNIDVSLNCSSLTPLK
jgi:hypothetical protein